MSLFVLGFDWALLLLIDINDKKYLPFLRTSASIKITVVIVKIGRIGI